MPVVLVGMEDFERKMRVQQRHARFYRRVLRWVEFDGLDLDDTRRVTQGLCEVEVADDLIERVHAAADGNIGHIVLSLGRIEQLASASDLEVVRLRDWGTRALSEKPRH